MATIGYEYAGLSLIPTPPASEAVMRTLMVCCVRSFNQRHDWRRNCYVPSQNPLQVGTERAELTAILILVLQPALIPLNVVRANNLSNIGEVLAKNSVSYYAASNVKSYIQSLIFFLRSSPCLTKLKICFLT